MISTGARSPILIFLAITLLCVTGLGLVLVSKGSRISEFDEQVENSRGVIAESQKTLSLVFSVLASQRGYLLSGDKAILADYEEDKKKLTENLAQLKGLSKKSLSQQSRVDELQHTYLLYTETLDAMVARYKAERNLGGLRDLQRVTDLRRDIDRITMTIINEEYKELKNDLKQLERARKSLFRQLSTGIILSSIILIILNSYLLWMRGRQLEAEESLKDTEERLRLAIRGTNDGIYDWDIEEQNLYWSPQFKLILGYEENEIEASKEALDALIHDDDRDHVWETIYKYLHRELPELSSVFRVRHKTGKWVWINMRGKAVFNADGTAIRLIGTYSDISDLKEYENRLEEAKNQAEKANEAKTEFLAHMSHEIRTPLTSISGVAEILDNQKKDFSDKHRQLIGVLNLSTTGLKELINDILDFSKIESGQLELEEKYFPLGDLFQEVISPMAVRAREKGLKFVFDYENVNDIIFFGDKMRVRQILMNLIGNALKFTHEGAVEIRALAQQDQNGHPVLRIDVQDSGIGIEKKNFPVIFERFRQADASVSRKYGGSGLGLAISKSLIESMGGTITLESEFGHGSIFHVALPLRMTEISESRHMEISKKDVGVPMRIGLQEEQRILLVEDYEGNIVVISYILEALGCKFDLARTGLEALNFWKERHPSLILMDVQMPEMDGLTATRQIRKMEEEQGLPRTPIIGMTAHAFVEDKDKCVDAGMDSYLAKPIAEDDLSQEILKYLQKEEARPGRQAS